MDTVLLKIKRAFTQDESVKYLMGELRKVKVEIGVKDSEISELKYLNNILNIENKNLSKKIKKQLSKEDLKEERFTEMNKELDTLRRKITKLNGDVDLWRSKWLNLIAKK
jgi:peptidoglycan hydrolase CwlO-like protein